MKTEIRADIIKTERKLHIACNGHGWDYYYEYYNTPEDLCAQTIKDIVRLIELTYSIKIEPGADCYMVIKKETEKAFKTIRDDIEERIKYWRNATKYQSFTITFDPLDYTGIDWWAQRGNKQEYV